MPGKRQLVNVEPLTTLRSHSQRRTGFLAEQYRAAAIGRTGAGNYGHGLHIAYASIDNVDFIGRKTSVLIVSYGRSYIWTPRAPRQPSTLAGLLCGAYTQISRAR